jgi:glycosyltransferase involved in cell wall biosynthesis
MITPAFTRRSVSGYAESGADQLFALSSATREYAPAEPGSRISGSLLVFADDWGRHPSSCQHLMARLTDRYRVYWVNTIGTRRPRLDLATLSRGWEKTRQWFRRIGAAAMAPANPHVLNPKMWPWFGSTYGRWLNRRLLKRQLTRVLRRMPEAPVAITTVPVVADLVGELPVRRWVYYCVDDFGEWPGLDQATLRRMEDRLVARADTVIAVSETLQEKLAGKQRESALLTHGVDLERWQAPANGAGVPELKGLEPPFIVFWGMVDRRMDAAFVRQLAKDLDRGTILLVGPAANPDPALAASPRVQQLPPMDFARLPLLAREAAVLIMPYADLPVTRAIQPLKLKEYLATGKPAVVSDLPATREWGDCLDLVSSPEAFSRQVRLRLRTGLPRDQHAARSRLVHESWAAKAWAFERLALATP